MVVAILGQDSNFVVLFLYLKEGLSAVVSLMTKRTAPAAFPIAPPADPVPTALSLFVALSPTQFSQLGADQPIIPDPYSERFGLRKDRLKALERAHYFTNWTPPHEVHSAALIHQKQFVLCKLLITPLGYMTLCEEGTPKAMDVITFVMAIFNGTDPCANHAVPQLVRRLNYHGSSKMNVK